jgi:hypothetical protein
MYAIIHKNSINVHNNEHFPVAQGTEHWATNPRVNSLNLFGESKKILLNIS